MDIDWGDYPYVYFKPLYDRWGASKRYPTTELSKKVYGITKAYDTYVGAKDFHGEGTVFDLLQSLGNGGATTGRPRQCNWLNVQDLKKAVDINGVTDVIINKVDILREVGEWNLRSSNNNAIMLKLGSEVAWKQYIRRLLNDNTNINVVFSESPRKDLK